MSSFPDPIAPSEQDVALAELFSLLVDLQCIEPPAAAIEPPPEPLAIEAAVLPETTGLAEMAVLSEQIVPLVSQVSSLEAIALPIEEVATKEVPIEEVAIDEAAALERLQQLLAAPDLAEFRLLVESLERKLAQMEHQLYEPAELMNLLLPWMAELLSRKVAESQEEVVQAIAPIIDQIIENRAAQDKLAMSTAIAPLIASAISRQSAQSPQEMAQAIAPTMGKAIKEQIVLERDAMVDALYPVIGSTIAKYMAEAVQAINQKIESAFSVEGIRRKLTAKLRGVSEAELILKEAMPCEVQAVFLIHKTTGLVLSEVQLHEGESDRELESELIAGMLTAIRSFADDCMTQAQPSELNHIDYGSFKILLEVAGYCYLAIVIAGNPPRHFLAAMRQTLEVTVQLYGTEIEQFDGDPTTISAAVPELLIKLARLDLAEPPQKSSIALLLGGLLVSAIALAGSYFHHHDSLHDRVESAAIDALAHAPELAVYRLEAEADHHTLHLFGQVPNVQLRQRAEQIVQSAAPDWTIDNQVQAVEIPADPVLAAAEVDRVTAILNQMEGAEIAASFAAGKVSVTGIVSQSADVQRIAQAFEQIPGVRSIATAIKVQPLQPQIRFYFRIGSADLAPADRRSKLPQVKAWLDRHPNQPVQITGYSNPVNGGIENQWLALQRAKAIRDALVQQGISPDRLQLAGLAQYPPPSGLDQPTWFGRSVEIKPLPFDEGVPQQ